MKTEIRKEKVIFWSDNGQMLGITEEPVIIELWNGQYSDGIRRISTGYSDISCDDRETEALAVIESREAGKIFVRDRYREEEKTVVLERTVQMIEKGASQGIRLCTDVILFPEENYRFEDMRYFAPPAIFDKNDLDEDGYEDYFHTKKTVFRDDRFNYPMFLYYSEIPGSKIIRTRQTCPSENFQSWFPPKYK